MRLLQVQARKKSDEHENCPFHHHEAGTWGIDRAADVVWAVLQHNSQFAALPGQLPAPPTDYASWKTLNFSEAERGDVAISGPEADPDSDGLGNIQEYAFLTAPRRFSPNPVTGSITQAGDSPPYLTITYKRRKGTSDLGFVPQFGSDAANFTLGVNVSTVDNLDGSETVTDRDNTTFQDLMGRRFARVRVGPP